MTNQLQTLFAETKAFLLEHSTDAQYPWNVAYLRQIEKAVKSAKVGACSVAAVRYLFKELDNNYYNLSDSFYHEHGVDCDHYEILRHMVENHL